VTHRRWITAAGAVVLLLASLFGVHRLVNARCFALTGPVICRVETSRPLVALSFDDGPTELGVRAVLPVLQAHGARATFFVLGSQVTASPHLVREIIAAGHEIGNHSFTHTRMLGRSQAFYDDEIGRTQAVLRQVGIVPETFRPPFGDKLVGLPLAVARAGLQTIMWDVSDPGTSDPDVYADEVVSAARPGSIILMHPMQTQNETARQALPAILEGLRRKGLEAVSVQELLASTARVSASE
jgi:peptidoglycan/xylan/chitin deacetylase (PgdA/CDA1 family)